jgi:CRISPR-associated protein (TIGR03986 family)
VPLYDPPSPGRRGQRPRRKATATGIAQARIAKDGWRDLHGEEVVYTTRPAKQVVDTIRLAGDRQAPAAATERRGWLSVTGRSIETKGSERLFVPADERVIPVLEQHHALWQAVLASYRDAAEYNEPGQGLERSRHVVVDGPVPEGLRHGDLVYLERDQSRRNVTAILPVSIGRLPYPAAPADLLDESLHPAAEPGQLSAADRLFGWAPQEAGAGRASASGYRGRLRVTSVRCLTSDWHTDLGDGVRLAPLSSPKPTQFRFYAASGPDGNPVRHGAPKDEGYQHGTGLRGRKAYWYPSTVPDGYWTPGTGRAREQVREWQATPDAKATQTATHLGWVREGAEFTIRLFLDAVPGAELGPLVWLAGQEGCPLRLGAGKPLGFGAVTVRIDWDATELRTREALRGCWLDLRRPDPCGREQVQALAAEFEQQAMSSPVLAPALTAFRKVAGGLASAACYPRTQREPEAETYRWFVENDRIKDRKVKYGFALPHVLEDNQDLPFLPREER